MAWWLLGGCALALVAVLLVPSPVHRAPFPRVFLVLLPAVTFGAALLAREWPWLNQLSQRGWWGLLASVFIFALIVSQGSEWLTAHQLDTASEPPQNLLQQYYRGNGGVSALLREYAEISEAQRKRQVVLVSPYDVPTSDYYWMLYGLPGKGDGGLPLVRPANTVKFENLANYRTYGYEYLILARHEHEARDWAQTIGFRESQVVPEGNWHDHHRLFRIVQQ